MTAKCVPAYLQVLLVLLFLLLISASSAKTSNKIKSWNIILKKVNMKGPYIGLITVFSPEEKAFFGTGAFKPNPRHPFVDLAGRRFLVGKLKGKDVIYVRCGIGTVNAAAVAQQMLDHFDIMGIVHFGIAGNINSSMNIGDVSIPKQFAHTGLWDWLNPDAELDTNYVAHLDVKNYNEPQGHGSNNLLGHIGYNKQELFSESGKPNNAQSIMWFPVSEHWLKLAANLEGMSLEQCVNSTLCLPAKPKLVVGLQGSTADIFVDNAAYRNFLFRNFKVSSADMESAAIVMTSLSNGFPVIVIRGLSDLAGEQSGENAMNTYGSLAANNTAKAVIQFIKMLY